LDDLDLLPVDFRRRENDKTPKDVEPVKPQVNAHSDGDCHPHFGERRLVGFVLPNEDKHEGDHGGNCAIRVEKLRLDAVAPHIAPVHPPRLIGCAFFFRDI
jgi:hypothetical protein